jgi:hypothetical protein
MSGPAHPNRRHTMFRLTPQEMELPNRSQVVTGSHKHPDPRFPPRAFTQEGVARESNVTWPLVSTWVQKGDRPKQAGRCYFDFVI